MLQFLLEAAAFHKYHSSLAFHWVFYCLLNISSVKLLKYKLSKVLRFKAIATIQNELQKMPAVSISMVVLYRDEKGPTPPPGSLHCIYSSSDTHNLTASSTHRDSWIFFFQKKNCATAQKMAFVNTKIKYPDDEPDCAQAFILARRQEMGEENLKKPLKRHSFSGSHSQSNLR